MKDALKEFMSKEQEYKGKGQYKRGQIYMLDYLKDVVGDEQYGNRPVIIVSNDVGNYHSFVKEVVPLTTKLKPKLPTHVLINSTKEESTALCEQILRVDDQRLGDYIGQCTQDEMSRIDEALAISVGIGLPQQMIDTGEDEMLKKAVDHINEILKTVIEIQEINKRIEQMKNDSISKLGDFIQPYIMDDINKYIEEKVKENLQHKYDIIQYLINGKNSNTREEKKSKLRISQEEIEEIRHQYEDEGKSMDQVAADMKIAKGTVSKVVKELGISRPKGRRKK